MCTVFCTIMLCCIGHVYVWRNKQRSASVQHSSSKCVHNRLHIECASSTLLHCLLQDTCEEFGMLCQYLGLLCLPQSSTTTVGPLTASSATCVHWFCKRPELLIQAWCQHFTQSVETSASSTTARVCRIGQWLIFDAWHKCVTFWSTVECMTPWLAVEFRQFRKSQFGLGDLVCIWYKWGQAYLPKVFQSGCPLHLKGICFAKWLQYSIYNTHPSHFGPSGHTMMWPCPPYINFSQFVVVAILHVVQRLAHLHIDIYRLFCWLFLFSANTLNRKIHL